MEDKKDIGQAFREKLDSLDRQPGDALWDSISRDLDTKKKRKFPFFWFSILSFSVLAIVGLVYFASNFSIDNNTGLTKQDNHQNNIPANHSTTGIQNPVENKNTLKASSANGIADHQNDADKRTDATDTNASDTNSASVNATATGKIKRNNKKGSNTGKAIVEAGTGSKTAINKNNATANKGRKQTISNQDETASTDNLKISTTTNKSKKHSTSLYNSKNKTAVASGNSTTESGYAAISSSSKISSKKTATQLKTSKEIAGPETEKQRRKLLGTTADNTAETSSTGTDTEITTREGIPTTAQDSLPETGLVLKDSLKTEPPKDEVVQEKEETKKDSLPPVTFKRFSAFAYGGPSFFNFPDSSIKTDSTTASVTTSNTIRYGVLFGYRINEKLSIRTGFAVSRLKQTAKDMKLSFYMFFSNTGSNVDIGIMPPPPIEGIDYYSTYWEAHTRVINEIGYDQYAAIINIERKLSYLEIPLEIGYTLFDKKFSLNIFGGGSMLFLTKNEVSAYNQKGTVLLGKWNEAAKTSCTGTLGLGLNYKITPSLQINAEPVFNYYFNTYKDSKPSSFTVRVGLQYNFDLWEKKE